MRPPLSSRPTVDVDHHSAEFAASAFETLADPRGRCPVVWYENHHDGFWTVLTHATGLEEAARLAAATCPEMAISTHE